MWISGRPQAKRKLLLALAALWGLGSDAVDLVTSLSKPKLQAGDADVAIGRAVLPMVVGRRAAKDAAAAARGVAADRKVCAPLGALWNTINTKCMQWLEPYV
jgi:hypothetical protein